MNGEAKEGGVKVEIPVYNDVWMDNGVVNLYKILNGVNGVHVNLKADKLEFEITEKERFLKGIKDKIKQKRDSIVFVTEKDDKTGEIRNIKKDFVLLQYGKKVGGKNVLKEKIYSDSEISERLEQIFEKIIGEGSSCILCGRTYLSGVDKLKQAVYPLVTKIRSLSGVRTLKEQYTELCPLCYLIGSLEWCDEGIIYRVFPTSHSLVFIPNIYDFQKLNESKSKWIDTVLTGERFSNIRISKGVEGVERTSGKYNTLLCFFEKFLRWICLEEEGGWMTFESVKKEVCRDWTCMEVPWGAVKNIKFENISVADDILGIMYELVKDDKYIYGNFVKQLLYLRKTPKGTQIDNAGTQEIREGLSRYFLMDNFSKFSHSLIPRKKGRIIFSKDAREVLEDLIYLWRLKKMGLEKEDLETIRSVGNIVAETSSKSIGLLYRLDKARNPNEFWNSLREISRKMIGLEKPVKAKSLDSLIQLVKEHEGDWEEIRNILVVYGCMYYYIKNFERGEK